MAPNHSANEIYSATYSNVPVFEYACGSEHVMRRRHDDWINATHILKVADFDKPARTRILERDVQKGVHEKVQGGYGKYQGTWVPLHSGRDLALRNGVFEKLRPIFDYVPGDISPPQAPKHTTAASNKPKLPKQAPIRRVPKSKPVPAARHMSEDMYDNISTHLNDDDSLDGSTIGSTTFMDEGDMYYKQGHTGGSRKRKRGLETSLRDQQHTMYADALLDYFMLSSSDAPLNLEPPQLPEGYEVEWKVDGQKHTALHWAAAMGDMEIVRTLLQRGADMFARNERGDTPLIRAVLFTNNFEKETMPKILSLLQATVEEPDYLDSTILHHIAMLTTSRQKKKCARYYLDVLLNKMSESMDQRRLMRFINKQDSNGDTALHIVVRHDAKKGVRALQGRGAAGDIPNQNNETADQMLQRSRGTQLDPYAFASSSPVLPEHPLSNGHAVERLPKPGVMTTSRYESQSAQSFSESFDSVAANGGMQVALALENEAREKDAQYAEALRLQDSTAEQRHQVRRATFAIFNEQGSVDDDDLVEAAKKTEVRLLQDEQESLLEQNQHRILHQDIRAEESALSPSAHTNTNGMIISNEEIKARLQAAADLQAAQARRRELTRLVAQAQANAGMTQTGHDCKRLVSSSTGIPVEDVPGMTSELLDQLETSKGEVDAAV